MEKIILLECSFIIRGLFANVLHPILKMLFVQEVLWKNVYLMLSQAVII